MAVTAATVRTLYRYPVKGFSPEPLIWRGSRLKRAARSRCDRAFAIENGPSGFDPEAPGYFPKNRFLMLMRNETVAEYQTRFDDEPRHSP